MTMTPEQFQQEILSRLRERRDQGWRVSRTGSIRNDGGQCPVCAAVDSHHQWAASAATRAAFPELVDVGPLVVPIAAAADNINGHDPTLRAAILEALDLEERE